MNSYANQILGLIFILCIQGFLTVMAQDPRDRILLKDRWRFYKYTDGQADTLIYDVRPPIIEGNDAKDADSKPTEALKVASRRTVLKPWISE